MLGFIKLDKQNYFNDNSFEPKYIVLQKIQNGRANNYECVCVCVWYARSLDGAIKKVLYLCVINR